MAGDYQVDMDRGATFVKDMLWKIAGKPVNLTGYTGFVMVRPDYESPVILFDLTSENGEITFDAEGGIHLTLPPEETSAVNAGLYVYDMFVKSSSQVIKLLSGTWRVRPSFFSEESSNGVA
jgi:hypothetical protein